MRILVTGASGYVGAGIYDFLKKKFDTIGTYHSKKLFSELKMLDITNKNEVSKVVSFIRPEIIVHVAANASASWCQKNPEKAIAINQEGTKNIVDAANEYGSKFIFISTMAIANKKSLYSKTKAKSEEYAKNTRKGWIILRPSLILGLSPNTENDRPFNRLLNNITKHTPAIYDTSWKFQPTWLRHLNEVIEKIIETGISNKIILVCVPELKTRYDIAKDILTEFNINAVPEDQKDTQPLFIGSLETLGDLDLPEYKYKEMIKGIIKEIKNYLKKISLE